MIKGDSARGGRFRVAPSGLRHAGACALVALLVLIGACARSADEDAVASVVTVVTRRPDPTEIHPPTQASKTQTPTPLRTATTSPSATLRPLEQADSTPPSTPSPAATVVVASEAGDAMPAEPSAQPRSASVVAVWESQITLNTYGWEQALVPTGPDDPVYPYPRLDFGRVGPPVPRAYQAVFLANDYLELTVVPELGGRILRWVDRVTGRQLFYANPVVRPTRWGARGWWLATGGMEWSFPVDEHGLNEYRPWHYELLWNGVRLWDTDDRTGLDVEVTIWLDRDRSHFSVAPRITNRTGDAQPYQFWTNAMLALSDGNTPSSDLRFVMPANAVTVHSSGDPGLPGPGSAMGWPVHDGRDFSRYSEWRKPLGLFARPPTAGFVGAYDPSVDQGIVRVFPHETVTGVKIFCLGDLGSELWTDDGSRYFELWGGITPTFWDYRTLQPGASVLWTESWYAVSGIGGFNWASTEAAIRLTPAGDRAEIGVSTTRAFDAAVVLLRGGAEVQRWNAWLAPDQPLRVTSDATSADGDWAVQVLERGFPIAQMGP